MSPRRKPIRPTTDHSGLAPCPHMYWSARGTSQKTSQNWLHDVLTSHSRGCAVARTLVLFRRETFALDDVGPLLDLGLEIGPELLRSRSRQLEAKSLELLARLRFLDDFQE